MLGQTSVPRTSKIRHRFFRPIDGQSTESDDRLRRNTSSERNRTSRMTASPNLTEPLWYEFVRCCLHVSTTNSRDYGGHRQSSFKPAIAIECGALYFWSAVLSEGFSSSISGRELRLAIMRSMAEETCFEGRIEWCLAVQMI